MQHLLGFALIAASAVAQQAAAAPAEDIHFRLHLVNGRTGVPIRDGHVRVWYDEPIGPGYVIATDQQGIALLPQPPGEPLRVLIEIDGLVDCRRPQRNAAPEGFNLKSLAATGVAADNSCGGTLLRPHRGELVYYVRPSRWYEGINSNAREPN